MRIVFSQFASKMPPESDHRSADAGASSAAEASSAKVSTQMPQLDLLALASDPPAPPPKDAESPLSDCFLCCEGPKPGEPLITGVCSCRRTAMHLNCQRRMLEAARSWDDDEQPSRMIMRCGVCHSTFVNADMSPYWRLSWLGALWLTCCAGVGVMLWSGYTVLEKGSSRDPRVSFWSREWWSFELTNLTWWRIVGLLYMTISIMMAGAALTWLAYDLFYSTGDHLDHLFVKHYAVRVWYPDCERARTRAARESAARTLL